jgi:malate dehydrogenase (oxaloacetate-decarboxylating)(NADP+)
MTENTTIDKAHQERLVGARLLNNPTLNKGTAFTEEERDALALRGLLPPRVSTLEEQAFRVLENFRSKASALEQYIYLTATLDRNETLFYRVLVDNIEELMPVIYTPTVGEACKRYAHIFRRSRGLYVSAKHKGRIKEVLSNWPEKDIRIIVVTDGERILGLGDLGANGMGIPVGKLSLYTACAGIDPTQCLPVLLDVGTDNEELLWDRLYLGHLQRRLRGVAYDAIVEEFVEGVQEVFPGCLIQFEDFASTNAFRLLSMYRDRVCCFNDDIQGTAAVVVAGIHSALRITGRPLSEQKFLFLGAGAASVGIGEMIVSDLVAGGLSEEEARLRCWFVDSKGLVVESRGAAMVPHKRPFAHPHEPTPDLLSAVEAIEPTMLIGASGQPNTFDQPIIEAMGRINERPVVFALSNPTSKAECTAEQAYRWTNGRAVFASGSPFGPVQLDSRTLVPGQGNNAYIFPGVGLGAVFSRATRVTDEMFLAAARTLAETVTDGDLERGSIYPPLSSIREVSAKIATSVARVAQKQGLVQQKLPRELEQKIREAMYEPHYVSLI